MDLNIRVGFLADVSVTAVPLGGGESGLYLLRTDQFICSLIHLIPISLSTPGWQVLGTKRGMRFSLCPQGVDGETAMQMLILMLCGKCQNRRVGKEMCGQGASLWSPEIGQKFRSDHVIPLA